MDSDFVIDLPEDANVVDFSEKSFTFMDLCSRIVNPFDFGSTLVFWTGDGAEDFGGVLLRD